MLEAEVAKLTDIFVKNGYPAHIVDRTIRQVLQTSSSVRDKEEGQQCASLKLRGSGTKVSNSDVNFMKQCEEHSQG